MIFNAFLVLIVFTTSHAVVMKFGKHDFPHKPVLGDIHAEYTNEFQLINPHRIEHSMSLTEGYSIDTVWPTLIDNNDVVTVTFSTLTPASNDWIGAYSPADVNISAVVPVRFGYCDEDNRYLSQGKGEMTFNFTNLRADVAFYYFTSSLSKPVLVAQAKEKVRFRNINQPLRPRVVPTGDYDVFQFLWSSATSKTPVLKWGTQSKQYDHIEQATTSTIEKKSLCGSPANGVGWRDLGLIHNATFKGMKALAGQKIFYIMGDEETKDFSQEYVFLAPPLPGQQPLNRPTRVALYDDLGRGSSDSSYTWNEYGRPAYSTILSLGARIAAGEIDAIYHGGDISYAEGYMAVWDFYGNMMAPVTSGVLYLTTVGNHESDWYNSPSLYNNSDSGGECGVATTRLFPMPAPATTDQPWWSYDIGLIHFVGISTEHNYSRGSIQYKWLEEDLRSVDRTITPWIVFGGHRAMYINSNYGTAVTSDIVVMDTMIEELEDLLFRYRVNVGFYGHNHVVQRHSAVYKKQVVQASQPVIAEDGHTIHWHEDPQATVQMVIGSGGAMFTINAVEPKPAWNEMYMYQYGYTLLTAVNATYLDWQWVLSQTDEVLDHMVITQSDPTKPWQKV